MGCWLQIRCRIQPARCNAQPRIVLPPPGDCHRIKSGPGGVAGMTPAVWAYPLGRATQFLGGNDNGTRRFSDPRQRSAHDGARRPLGALPRGAPSGQPAAVLRRAAAAACAERRRQGQRRLDHGHGGAGSGDPGAQHAAGRDRVEPRIAPPQPGAASAFPAGAGARLRRGLDPDRDGHRGDRCRGHVRHARPADPVP